MALTRGERTALVWTVGFLTFGGLLKAHQSHDVKWGRAFLLPPPHDSSITGGKGMPAYRTPKLAPRLEMKDSLPIRSSQVPTEKRKEEEYAKAKDHAPEIAKTSDSAALWSQKTASMPQGCPVSLNDGSVNQLTLLPGIGPKMAERIVAYRLSHGPFRNMVDLRKVKGIGQKKLDRMRTCLIL